MQATTPLHYPATNSQQQTASYSSSQHVVQQSTGGAAYGGPMAVSAVTPSYQASYYQGGAGPASYATNVVGGSVASYGYNTSACASATRGTPAGPERVQSTRKISSTIVNEQVMGPPPQDYPVREVEVPGPVQEIVTHVPRKEVIETERRVPKYEYEYVDKIVEVPRIEYVDKVVEVPQYQEVIVEKRVPQIVDVPRDVVREVKIPKINYVEKTVEVPGQVIEVPKPYTVEQKVEFTRYTDKKKPVIVAQSVKPVIVEGAGVTEVDVYEYEPEIVPVDVHVVKGVQAQVQAGGVIETTHRVVTVPSAQYNTILKQLNVHLQQNELQKLPYLQERGQTVFLGERFYTADVQHGVVVQGLDMHNLVNTYVDHASRRVLPINDPRVGMATQTTTQTTTAYGAGASAGQAAYSGSAAYGGAVGGGAVYGASTLMPATGSVTSYVGPTQVEYRQEQHYSSTSGARPSSMLGRPSPTGMISVPSSSLNMQPTHTYAYPTTVHHNLASPIPTSS